LRNGILVIAPRVIDPGTLVVASHLWPLVLSSLRVRRAAILLSVQTYMTAEPVLRNCSRLMKARGLAFAFFHEGHLASDMIVAWFERRKPRNPLTSATMLALGEHYQARGDSRGAFHAREIAERLTGSATRISSSSI
jgi:hypothetical protein